MLAALLERLGLGRHEPLALALDPGHPKAPKDTAKARGLRRRLPDIR